MKRTFVIPALLFLAASAIAHTTCAQSKSPVSTALRDIVRQDGTHVMDLQIGESVRRGIA